jgi:hypothetical protein
MVGTQTPHQRSSPDALQLEATSPADVYVLCEVLAGTGECYLLRGLS